MSENRFLAEAFVIFIIVPFCGWLLKLESRRAAPLGPTVFFCQIVSSRLFFFRYTTHNTFLPFPFPSRAPYAAGYVRLRCVPALHGRCSVAVFVVLPRVVCFFCHAFLLKTGFVLSPLSCKKNKKNKKKKSNNEGHIFSAFVAAAQAQDSPALQAPLAQYPKDTCWCVFGTPDTSGAATVSSGTLISLGGGQVANNMPGWIDPETAGMEAGSYGKKENCFLAEAFVIFIIVPFCGWLLKLESRRAAPLGPTVFFCQIVSSRLFFFRYTTHNTFLPFPFPFPFSGAVRCWLRTFTVFPHCTGDVL